MPAYDFRVLDSSAEGLARSAALLGAVLSPALDHRYLTWLYTDNPAGPAVGFEAFDDGVLAAHYATIPIEAWINDRLEKGLLSLNTATHPGHQGKGLFPRLAERTYAHAAEHGYGFVVGVANARSTRGFTDKLGFQLVAPLDVRVGVGGLKSRERAAYSYVTHWPEAAVAWRLKRPGARYVAGGRQGETRDVFARISIPGLLALLDAVPARVADTLPGAPALAPFRLQIGLDRLARRAGVLLPVPDGLKASPLNLIFRDLRGTGRTLDANQVRWTLLDFDAY
jgi:GNAT superfamily N-acetyltransferase